MRVVVLVEREVHAVHQLQERLRLRLGGRGGAAVRLGRRIGVRALVVVVPARREVPVRVDAVERGDLPVAVVVAQVLPPQAVRRREREVVPVGVRDQDEPQLARVHEVRELRRRHARHGLAVGPDRGPGAAVVVHEQPQRAAAGLAREPFARVLDGRVEHRRAAAVLDRAGVVRDLHRVDRQPAQRLPDRDQLRDAAVLLRDPLELGLDVRRRVAGGAGDRDVPARVRPPDLPAVGSLGGGDAVAPRPRRSRISVARDAGLAELL